jgi:hypothetical protein
MAEGFKLSPRCNPLDPCCGTTPPECGFFDDDFERAATSTLGDKWAEAVGDWEIDASGRLVIDTSDARARPLWFTGAVWTTFGILTDLYLRAVVSATADGDEILIGNRMGNFFIGYSDRCVFGLRVGAAAKIWFGDADPAGTIAYDCPVTAAANTEHTIIFDCGVVYLNGTAVCNIISLIDAVNVADLFIGTNDVTGEVRFQELIIEKTRASHPMSGCPTCPICPVILGESPNTLDVVVAGHTGDWATLNGNYTLTRTQDHDRSSGVPCLYTITGLGKTFVATGDDIDSLTLVVSGGLGAYFEAAGGAAVFNVQYQYPGPTLPCAGDDAVLNYTSSGSAGFDIDPGLTQAGSTLTVNL